ncbi:MAG: HNH endonuclease [Bacteroidetes bacterium]|nr:HNH endonuclease [Bacteroidota bacterium]MCL5737757.1 HNH endonuclease [Bacteroidota bacterium]
MKKQNPPKQFLKMARTITNKRAKIVIEHILKHGFITTEDLETKYGYNHPPRAARDVREAGIPLETFKVKDRKGRSIAAYRFGDFSKIQKNKLSGRAVFSKEFKEELFKMQSGRCAICNGTFETRYLQIDHRVPYEVAGDKASTKKETSEFMLLCASCNRAKSWSCEHCINWEQEKDKDICSKCYWGNPENYLHIALRTVRRLDILWEENEIKSYDRLRTLAEQEKTPLPDFVKKTLEKQFKN